MPSQLKSSIHRCVARPVSAGECRSGSAALCADLDWLKENGVHVVRYNLAQEPGAFAAAPVVQAALKERGTECLPLILVDGRIVSEGRYPTRAELVGWTGLDNDLICTTEHCWVTRADLVGGTGFDGPPLSALYSRRWRNWSPSAPRSPRTANPASSITTTRPASSACRKRTWPVRSPPRSG